MESPIVYRLLALTEINARSSQTYQANPILIGERAVFYVYISITSVPWYLPRYLDTHVGSSVYTYLSTGRGEYTPVARSQNNSLASVLSEDGLQKESKCNLNFTTITEALLQHGKERLDKWYRLAKEKGYRARAAFKLIQLNRKYGFLQNSKVLLDLCSAPGVRLPFLLGLAEANCSKSWSQVAAETMPRDSLIVGVDIVSVKPIPRTIGIQGDIMTDQCVASIQRTLKTLKADAVIHDGAPNVGTSWTHDAFSQAGLVLQATKLAAKFLRPGGIFVTKIFRSKDYNALLWILQQLFVSAEVTKPPASRNLSAEIYVTCKGFKAPKYIDPRFLDPRHVFAELSAKGHAIESKVLKPEESRRKRDGYADDEWNQFKEVPASRFIESSDTITLLATCNKFSFNQLEHGSPFLLALESLPVTSAEIKACCDDLRVLGKKDFRALLRWRARCREILSLEQEDNVPATQLETLSGNGSLRHGTETRESAQDIRRRLAAKEKKQSRKERESRRQDIQRMHLHMQTPTDIGLNQATLGDDHVASGQSNTEQQRLSGMIVRDHSIDSCVHEVGIGNSDDDSSDDDGNQLEKELDYSYEQYKARRLHPREKDKNALQEAKRFVPLQLKVLTLTLSTAQFPLIRETPRLPSIFRNCRASRIRLLFLKMDLSPI